MTIRKEKAKIKALVPREARPFDVVAIGENSLDILATTPEWPEPDAKLDLTRLEWLPGGQVATAAMAAARLGARTRYLGATGDDQGGAVVRQALTQGGVETHLLTRRGARTRSAVVLVDAATGRRTVLAHRDSALRLAPGEIPAGWVESGRVLMLDDTDVEAGVEAADRARRAGIAVVLDAERSEPSTEPLLDRADVLIAAQPFPQAHTGAARFEDAIKALDRRYEPAVLVVTLGADGAIALFEGRIVRVPGRSVSVIDTTGAGDVFRGALVAGWTAAGGAPDIPTLLAQAAAAAAINCTAVGAQGRLPAWDEIKALL